MPTRGGAMALVAGLAGVALGRVFGIVEAYVLGTAAITAVVLALLAVNLRRPEVAVTRWVHPKVLAVGDTGRVDLLITPARRRRTPPLALAEQVGEDRTARLAVAGLRPGDEVTIGYRIPAERRGILAVGPLVATRTDVLGLAATRRGVAGVDELVVAPRTVDLAMPVLGHGSLGRHLEARARRLGAGEFHGLRTYRPGDEPRTIHWRASARSDELQVKELTTEGVRRCIVVLDRDLASFDDADRFEVAVSVAASLVASADRAGLTTRFVSAGGIDLRGPDVAVTSSRVLAAVTRGPALEPLERDPGDGLGLVVLVTASPTSRAWRAVDAVLDPSTTRLGVVVADDHTSLGPFTLAAPDLPTFAAGWTGLTTNRRAGDRTGGASTARARRSSTAGAATR